jgi:protein-disulfide isomerase
MLRSPNAMGLGALWLIGSLALVALFPREAIRAEGAASPVPSIPVETLDQVQLAEWHKWIDAQPRVPEVVALQPQGVKVFVVKFNDYQCPACRMTYFAYKDIVAKYEASNPSDFRYETRDFPLNSKCGAGMAHAYACEAAVAVRLAKAKDPAKGKELENWLFERQDNFSVDLIKKGLSEIAQVNSFDADYPKTIEAIRADVKLGTTVGVNGTPTFFLNGIRINSLRPAYLDAAIAYLLSKGT